MLALLVFRAAWSLVVPIILIVAAFHLWRCAPKWIPCVFVCVAVVSTLGAALSLLIRIVSIEQYSRIAVWIATAHQIVGPIFAVAILMLTIRTKRMTEQSHAGDAVNAAPDA